MCEVPAPPTGHMPSPPTPLLPLTQSYNSHLRAKAETGDKWLSMGVGVGGALSCRGEPFNPSSLRCISHCFPATSMCPFVFQSGEKISVVSLYHLYLRQVPGNSRMSGCARGWGCTEMQSDREDV